MSSLIKKNPFDKNPFDDIKDYLFVYLLVKTVLDKGTG